MLFSLKGHFNNPLCHFLLQCCNLVLDHRNNTFKRQNRSFRTVAQFTFNAAIGKRTRADGQANRDADQIGILKFDARLFVAVVVQHLDSG